MFTKNKDESWAAGLFGGTDCRMQRTATVLGRRKEEFFLIFFLMSTWVSWLNILLSSSRPWNEWNDLSHVKKDELSPDLWRMTVAFWEYAVNALTQSLPHSMVDARAIGCEHTGNLSVVTESHSVLLRLWMDFEPAPLGALTPTTLLISIQRATWVFSFHTRYPESYWVHRGCFLSIPEWS